jgi:hypothetical protein
MAQLTAVGRIDGVGGRNGLRIILVNGFAMAQTRIVVVQNDGRAFFRTCAARDAFIGIHIARLLADLDLETAFFAADIFQLGVCQKVDIKMPADLDQLG